MTNPFSCHIWLHSSINIQPPSLEASIVMKWARGEALLLLPHNCEVAHLNVGSQLLRVLQLAELLPTLGNVSFMEDSKYSMCVICAPPKSTGIGSSSPMSQLWISSLQTGWMLYGMLLLLLEQCKLYHFFFFLGCEGWSWVLNAHLTERNKEFYCQDLCWKPNLYFLYSCSWRVILSLLVRVLKLETWVYCRP